MQENVAQKQKDKVCKKRRKNKNEAGEFVKVYIFTESKSPFYCFGAEMAAARAIAGFLSF